MVRLIIIFLLLITLETKAQHRGYDISGGVRINKFNYGFSLKNYIGQSNSSGYELCLLRVNSATGGYMVSSAYNQKFSIFNPQLQLYLSFQMSIGGYLAYYEPGYFDFRGTLQRYDKASFAYGIIGSIGFEYIVPGTPITLGLELTPTYALKRPSPEFIDISIPFRYCFPSVHSSYPHRR